MLRETIDRPITSELSAVKDGGRTMGELRGRVLDIILLYRCNRCDGEIKGGIHVGETRTI